MSRGLIAPGHAENGVRGTRGPRLCDEGLSDRGSRPRNYRFDNFKSHARVSPGSLRGGASVPYARVRRYVAYRPERLPVENGFGALYPSARLKDRRL